MAIGQVVEKVANIEDETTRCAYEVFRFKTISGKIRHVRIDRGNAYSVRYVYRELLRANAALPADVRQAEIAVQRAIATQRVRPAMHAAQLGLAAAARRLCLPG
jgi:hypothetical protein